MISGTGRTSAACRNRQMQRQNYKRTVNVLFELWDGILTGLLNDLLSTPCFCFMTKKERARKLDHAVDHV